MGPRVCREWGVAVCWFYANLCNSERASKSYLSSSCQSIHFKFWIKLNESCLYLGVSLFLYTASVSVSATGSSSSGTGLATAAALSPLLAQSLPLNMSKQNKQFFHNYSQVCAPVQVLLCRSQVFISTRSPAEAALSETQLIFPPALPVLLFLW